MSYLKEWLRKITEHLDFAFILLFPMGLALACGDIIIRLCLKWVAHIDCFSGVEALVWGVLVVDAVGMFCWWLHAGDGMSKDLRWATIGTAVVISLVYLTMLFSLWADGWFANYVAMCAKHIQVIQTIRFIGCCAMIAGCSWTAKWFHAKWQNKNATS